MDLHRQPADYRITLPMDARRLRYKPGTQYVPLKSLLIAQRLATLLHILKCG